MMKEKRKGMLQRGIMVAVSALTVVASAGTVMAYEPIASSDESFEDVIFDEALNDFGDSYSEFDMINSLNFSWQFTGTLSNPIKTSGLCKIAGIRSFNF